MDDRKEKLIDGSMNDWVNRWMDGQKDGEMVPSPQPLWLWSSVYSNFWSCLCHSDCSQQVTSSVQYRRLSNWPPDLPPFMVLSLLFFLWCLSPALCLPSPKPCSYVAHLNSLLSPSLQAASASQKKRDPLLFPTDAHLSTFLGCHLPIFQNHFWWLHLVLPERLFWGCAFALSLLLISWV